MKKIVLINLFLTLIHCGITAQEQAEFYTKNLDAYVGTWQYATATDTFRIVLKKGIESTRHSYCECLIGGYCHVKNGVLVGDYIGAGNFPAQFLDKDIYMTDLSITVSGTNAFVNPNSIDPNRIRIHFKDIGLGKSTMKGQMLLLSPTQARWILKAGEADIALLPGEVPPPVGFSVPKDVVMTKISGTTPPSHTIILRPPVVSWPSGGTTTPGHVNDPNPKK